MFSTVPIQATGELDGPIAEMTHSPYVALPPQAPLDVVARTMADLGIHAVLIRDQANGLLGWVTARGMLHNKPRDWTRSQAGDAVTEPIATIPPTATVEDAVAAFVVSGASHIVVCEPESEWPIGVIADSDLIRWIARRP